MNTITIGVDLAKSVFSVCEVDGSGRVLCRLDLKRDAFGNRLRGLLAEFGIVVAKSDHALRVALADLDQHTALRPEMRELLRDLSAH